MVNRIDDSRNPDAAPGYELALLLLGGFRALVDELHAELAEQGHPDLRPVHGFAMQAIGADGASATELARRLGVSKQAAGKTVERLVALGYAQRAADPDDARRKLVRLTPHGLDALRRSARVFDALADRWATQLGRERFAALVADLRAVAPGGFALDVPGWLGGG